MKMENITDKDNAFMGPYRATKLWNDVHKTIRMELPIGKHRRYMKTYDDCFIANEAVEWMHDHLKLNPNFGFEVTRHQTIQLLQKFHKSRLFEDVRGSKHNRSEFADNGRLYRFIYNSPVKSTNTRTPLSNRTNIPQPVQLDYDKMTPVTCIPAAGLPECHLVAKNLTANEIEDVWMDMTLKSLRNILCLKSLDDFLDPKFVNGRSIMHNTLFVNKSGVVTNIDANDQLPHWALSAMKCLAHWPRKVDENLPTYAGFEKDVFAVVKDYFANLNEPLFTHEMYEVITNVFVRADIRTSRHSSPMSAEPRTPPDLSSFASVENLLQNITNSMWTSPDFPRMPKKPFPSSASLHLSSMNPIAESSRYGSTLSLPVTRYETAFGPDNKTVTRVYYDVNGASLSDFGYQTCQIDLGFKNSVDAKLNEGHAESSSTSYQQYLQKGSTSSLPRQRKDTSNEWRTRSRNLSAEGNSRSRRPVSCHISGQIESYGFAAGVVKPQRNTQNNSGGSESSGNIQCANLSDRVPNATCQRSETSNPPPYISPPNYHTLFYYDHQHPVINGATLNRKRTLHQTTLEGRKTPGSGGSPRDGVFSPRSVSMVNLSAPHSSSRSLSNSEAANLNRFDSSPNISIHSTVDRMQKALQLCCLLMPPANRRKLHLLLRLMYKMSNNDELLLHDMQSTRDLVLETFSRCILSSPEEADMDEILVARIIAFMMDNYAEIMAVPKNLKENVEDKLSRIQRLQVSSTTYETQKLSNSQKALVDLLNGIVNDATMSQKDKRKRLKNFQKAYPDIYDQHYTGEDEDLKTRPVVKPKFKQPLLPNRLLKLKKLRL